MDSFQKEIDERTNLTASNKFELLLFRLGADPHGERSELFGINVFKIREIVPMPPVTKAAGTHSPMLGMVNIRGQIISVIDLPAVVGCVPKTGLNILLVTEYARSTQAFAVESVDEIVRLEWSQVLSAETSSGGAFVTSIARLDHDKDTSRLAQVLDVEQILHEIMPSDRNMKMENLEKSAGHGMRPGAVAIAADDSKVARSLIEQGLRAMEIPFEMHVTGKEAWEKIQKLAAEARAEGKPISEKISFVLTDLEMPEMDGFTLTRNIKREDFLKNIPVIIHSSLSGSANEDHVRGVGGDAYVAKFEANELAATIYGVLDKNMAKA
ncbi:chemotaxis protein CheV [Herbaspirillum rubrisubalbicans]|jgi:two-component system chemotaxis response regulator CheV|uniref:Chemotaxis protein CheV n=2 Tax=Herbaspirillum rubrisubalbicans TaxID=80842 RepID=A0AAD0U6L8_9BURK|nr:MULTISPECIES: chemotaxis protein [Herbaspirillum]ALU89032.1 chemotaxis signal transduction protein [Herbaspirillum rubrisubalbicans M1]AYR24059.1 chemotaxis protein CheV [Herbaspirillum rubrisubalbicans]MCP1571993.1 two-component system chemotaxis response regulator CheV [Herbaspirillum rubrisubalbicans]NQE48473.1 chemotaxis protein CheV [Herbaspirillum rubrisubalbicans]QJQ00650.1 chemotaxis protein CheV [Herbaspirillum rubrisubalbicans Os34]